MAVTATMYPKGFEAILNKEIDLLDDSIKVMLCTSSYTPAATHKYKSDVTNEVSGAGYTAGGAELAGKTGSTTGSVFTFDANDVTWSSSTLTARYAVFYDATPGSDATRPLIARWDFGQNEVSSSGNFTLTISGSGIFTITAS